MTEKGWSPRLSLKTITERLEAVLEKAEANDFTTTGEDRALKQAIEILRDVPRLQDRWPERRWK